MGAKCIDIGRSQIAGPKCQSRHQAANLEAQAAGMQVYKANAGLLPRIDWNFNTNGSFNKVNLEFIDGRTLDRYGRSFAPGSNVSLSWTLYDGNRMQNRYDILKNKVNWLASQPNKLQKNCSEP